MTTTSSKGEEAVYISEDQVAKLLDIPLRIMVMMRCVDNLFLRYKTSAWSGDRVYHKDDVMLLKQNNERQREIVTEMRSALTDTERRRLCEEYIRLNKNPRRGC